jgi:chromosome partitioning protein
MPKIISFANQKGGVGKTTISLQTIYELVSQGKKVLAIDFDGQGNLSSRLRFDLEGQELEGTRTAELYRDDHFDIKPVICSDNLHLIYANTNDPELFEIESAPISAATNPKRHIDKIKDNYDFIIIDCPPTLGRNLLAALALSTHVITIVKVSGFAVDGALGLMNTISVVQSDVNRGLVNAGFLVNMFDNSPTHWKSYNLLKEELGDLLFENRMRYRTPLDTATSEGIAVKTLNYAHVTSGELDAVLQEIFRRVS